MSLRNYKDQGVYKGFVSLLALIFTIMSLGFPLPSYARSVLNLPEAGKMIAMSSGYTPAILRGLTLYPENPFKIDFFVDKGDDNLKDKELEDESSKLIKYFLSALTVPEEEMWVNLSPYEKDRIIPENFGKTEMGRDLLAQDYLLKQISASLMYPEEELGSQFWSRVHTRTQEEYDTTDIPVNAFNKVWIVPAKATVHVNGKNVFVIDNYLKVMLEKDYLATYHNDDNKKDTATDSNFSSEILKEIIIPEIEREVNEGSHFANLRQIYNAIILAKWYKQNIKDNILDTVFVNKKKMEGLSVKDKKIFQEIYEQYIDAFKTGVFNYIKEDTDPQTQEVIPRHYISGGAFLNPEVRENRNYAMLSRKKWMNPGAKALSTVAVLLACAGPGCSYIQPGLMPIAKKQSIITEEKIRQAMHTVDYATHLNAFLILKDEELAKDKAQKMDAAAIEISGILKSLTELLVKLKGNVDTLSQIKLKGYLELINEQYLRKVGLRIVARNNGDEPYQLSEVDREIIVEENEPERLTVEFRRIPSDLEALPWAKAFVNNDVEISVPLPAFELMEGSLDHSSGIKYYKMKKKGSYAVSKFTFRHEGKTYYLRFGYEHFSHNEKRGVSAMTFKIFMAGDDYADKHKTLEGRIVIENLASGMSAMKYLGFLDRLFPLAIYKRSGFPYSADELRELKKKVDEGQKEGISIPGNYQEILEEQRQKKLAKKVKGEESESKDKAMLAEDAFKKNLAAAKKVQEEDAIASVLSVLKGEAQEAGLINTYFDTTLNQSGILKFGTVDRTALISFYAQNAGVKIRVFILDDESRKGKVKIVVVKLSEDGKTLGKVLGTRMINSDQKYYFASYKSLTEINAKAQREKLLAVIAGKREEESLVGITYDDQLQSSDGKLPVGTAGITGAAHMELGRPYKGADVTVSIKRNEEGQIIYTVTPKTASDKTPPVAFIMDKSKAPYFKRYYSEEEKNYGRISADILTVVKGDKKEEDLIGESFVTTTGENGNVHLGNIPIKKGKKTTYRAVRIQISSRYKGKKVSITIRRSSDGKEILYVPALLDDKGKPLAVPLAVSVMDLSKISAFRQKQKVLSTTGGIPWNRVWSEDLAVGGRVIGAKGLTFEEDIETIKSKEVITKKVFESLNESTLKRLFEMAAEQYGVPAIYLTEDELAKAEPDILPGRNLYWMITNYRRIYRENHGKGLLIDYMRADLGLDRPATLEEGLWFINESKRKLRWERVGIEATRFLLEKLLQKVNKAPSQLSPKDLEVPLEEIGNRSIGGGLITYWKGKRTAEFKGTDIEYIVDQVKPRYFPTVEDELEMLKGYESIPWAKVTISAKRRLVEILAGKAEVSPRELMGNDYKNYVIEEIGDRPIEGLYHFYRRAQPSGDKRSVVEYIADELGIGAMDALDVLIEKYDLESAIATGVDDPDALLSYIMLTTDLTPDVARSIVVQSFHGLRGPGDSQEVLKRYNDFTQTEDTVEIDEYEEETESLSLDISGRVNGNFSNVMILNTMRTKDSNGKITSRTISKVVRADKDGNFSARFIPARGSETHLTFFGINTINRTRGQPTTIKIKQTSPPKNLEEILEELLAKKDDVRERIANEPHQVSYLTKRLERSLLRHFTEDEEVGFAYLRDKVKQSKNDLMRTIYGSILEKFRGIAEREIPDFREDRRLYFYQKYAIYEIQTRAAIPGNPGVILALEQGLGKTVVTLAAVRDHKAGSMMAVPNAVLGSWGEQEGKFFGHPKTELIRGAHSRVKTKMIQDAGPVPKVVNIEYLRVDDDRYAAMNFHPDQVVVIDESQFLAREQSLQSRGARNLEGWLLLSSATPFSSLENSRNVLRFMSRSTKAFDDKGVYGQLFSKGDPNSLRLLHFMFDEFVIRIKKSDVFKEQDREEGLKRGRLPKKNHVPPSELGEFELTMGQSDSTLDIFTNWPAWSEAQQKRGELTTDDAILRRGKGASFFSKLHSMRQTRGDPGYVGLDESSPKRDIVDKIVKKEVIDGKGKIAIFTRYRDEVKAYYEKYRDLGFVTYYGETSQTEGMIVKAGMLADKDGKILKFKMTNKFEYEIGEDGRPILADEDSEGAAITPQDYNVLVFQNDPNVRGIVLTEESGSFGITLTAADALIHDDPARDYTTRYQKEDRIHRVDDDRLKYEVRYYDLIAKYPEAFLEKTRQISVIYDKETGDKEIRKNNLISADMRSDPNLEIESVFDVYFAQGTYDQVHLESMEIQKAIFELVMDGLQEGDKDSLIINDRLREKVPGLFEGVVATANKAMLVGEEKITNQWLEELIYVSEGIEEESTFIVAYKVWKEWSKRLKFIFGTISKKEFKSTLDGQLHSFEAQQWMIEHLNEQWKKRGFDRIYGSMLVRMQDIRFQFINKEIDKDVMTKRRLLEIAKNLGTDSEYGLALAWQIIDVVTHLRQAGMHREFNYDVFYDNDYLVELSEKFDEVLEWSISRPELWEQAFEGEEGYQSRSDNQVKFGDMMLWTYRMMIDPTINNPEFFGSKEGYRKVTRQGAESRWGDEPQKATAEYAAKILKANNKHLKQDEKRKLTEQVLNMTGNDWEKKNLRNPDLFYMERKDNISLIIREFDLDVRFQQSVPFQVNEPIVTLALKDDLLFKNQKAAEEFWSFAREPSRNSPITHTLRAHQKGESFYPQVYTRELLDEVFANKAMISIIDLIELIMVSDFQILPVLGSSGQELYDTDAHMHYAKEIHDDYDLVVWSQLTSRIFNVGLRYQGLLIPFLQVENIVNQVGSMSRFVSPELLTWFVERLLENNDSEYFGNFIKDEFRTGEYQPQSIVGSSHFEKLKDLTSRLEQMTVKMQYEDGDGEFKDIGSGFFTEIDGETYLVTAEHLLHDKIKSFRAVTTDKTNIPLELIGSAKDRDVAVFRLGTHPPANLSIIPIAETQYDGKGDPSLRSGRNLRSKIEEERDKVSFIWGWMYHLSTQLEQALHIDTPNAKGMSGGPVVDPQIQKVVAVNSITSSKDADVAAIDQAIVREIISNAAMLTHKGIEDLGGIDMNPNNFEIETQGEVFDVQWQNIDIEVLQNLEINGFIPTIINITPTTNLPLLLGFKELDPAEEPYELSAR